MGRPGCPADRPALDACDLMKSTESNADYTTHFYFLDGIIIFSFIFTFAPTFNRLIQYGWRNADYSHAYFVLPISLSIVAWRWKELERNDAHLGQSTGWLMLLAGLLAYIFGSRNEFMFLESLGFCLTVWAVFQLRFTTASVRKKIFPLTYLLFLVPPPTIVLDTLTLPLKKISTAGSALMLKAFHLPVEAHGAILQVGTYKLFVADACSGLRFVVTLLALGLVYLYFQKLSLKTKSWLVVAIIILAVISNIVRITLTGLLAYWGGIKLAEGFFHEFSGVVIFVLTSIGLAGLTEWMIKKERRNE